MHIQTLRAAALAIALALVATATATAAPAGSTRIDETIDLTGTTLVGAGCTGGTLTYTSGWEHITGTIRTGRANIRAEYGFAAVDSLTGERFSGAGARRQVLRGSNSLFHINLRLSGDRGSRIMLTGTIHFDPSGQRGQLAHSLDCVHQGR